MAVIRRVPRYKLAQIYPEFSKEILKKMMMIQIHNQIQLLRLCLMKTTENKVGKITHTLV